MKSLFCFSKESRSLNGSMVSRSECWADACQDPKPAKEPAQSRIWALRSTFMCSWDTGMRRSWQFHPWFKCMATTFISYEHNVSQRSLVSKGQDGTKTLPPKEAGNTEACPPLPPPLFLKTKFYHQCRERRGFKKILVFWSSLLSPEQILTPWPLSCGLPIPTQPRGGSKISLIFLY